MRNARQSCYLDTIALICCAIYNLAQKNNLIVILPDRHVQVENTLEALGQFGEFVVVGGKQSFGAELLVNVFNN